MSRIIKAFGIGLVLMLVGCTTRPPSPTATVAPTPTPQSDPATNIEDIVGIWEHRLVSVPDFMQIGEDGSMTAARGVPENLVEHPSVMSEGWFEGNRFMVKMIDAVFPQLKEACIGVVGIYEVQLLADGSLRFVVIEDECGERAEFGLSGDWEPVQ